MQIFVQEFIFYHQLVLTFSLDAVRRRWSIMMNSWLGLVGGNSVLLPHPQMTEMWQPSLLRAVVDEVPAAAAVTGEKHAPFKAHLS